MVVSNADSPGAAAADVLMNLILETQIQSYATDTQQDFLRLDQYPLPHPEYIDSNHPIIKIDGL